VRQKLDDIWRQANGSIVPPQRIDVVNASGVIGHHFDGETIAPVVAECARVLGPGGIAMLDVGPSLSGPDLRNVMTGAGFRFLGHYRSGWWDPTGQMVFSPAIDKSAHKRRLID
jgi:SAM-dependent methyltransferase